MNRYVVGALALVVLVGGMITALTQARGRNATPGQVPDVAVTATVAATPASLMDDPANRALPGIALRDATVVEGRVVPLETYDLRFETSGSVAEILVKEGATLAKGDIIARLESRALELDIKSAEADLAVARAEYNLLLAGATPQQISQAQARLDRAKAAREFAEVSVTDRDIAATQTQIDALRVKLKELEARPSAEDIAVAKAFLDQEVQHLQANKDTLSAEKSVLEAQLEKTANDLRNAQDYLALLKLQNGEGKLSPAQQDEEVRARRAVEDAEQDLKAARIKLDEAKKVEVSTIAAVEARVRSAQAKLNQVLASKPTDQIAQTKADIAQVEAQLSKQREEFREAQLNLSDAEIDIAQSDLDRVTAKSRTVELAPLEARIHEREIFLEQRRYAMERMVLRAPAAGVLAELNLDVGQIVGEAPVGVIADTSVWVIQALDVSEMSIVSLREGDTVAVSVFALPGLELTGTITKVRTIGQAVRGQDTTYSLIITPETRDDRLRWNMTAAIQLLPQP